MAELNEDILEKLTELSCIECSQEEKAQLLVDLKQILTYAEQLQEIDTEQVAPCNHVLEEVTNVMRDDRAEHTLSRESFLSNTSEQIGGMIKVPPVINNSQVTPE